MPHGELDPWSKTLRPLPSEPHHGLLAVSILALISFVSATVFFLYIAYKLLAWWSVVTCPRQAQPGAGNCQRKPPDVETGHLRSVHEETAPWITSDASSAAGSTPQRRPPNQFLVLIANLFFADSLQALAFLLNMDWVVQNAIVVDRPTCFVQGFFVSMGDLASSMFVMSIAVHTYLSVVRAYQPPQKMLYIWIFGIWVFVLLMAVIPMGATRNGAEFGGFYVRAGSWCWVNWRYDHVRLFAHYLYIFICLFVVTALYILICISVLRRGRSLPREESTDFQLQLNHSRAFLIYPLIYILCTMPLATMRAVNLADIDISMGCWDFAGGMIAMNGAFDCLLFGATRHAIVFGSKYNVADADTGINTFSFIRTPRNREYGNIVWVQGGDGEEEEEQGDQNRGGWLAWPRRALRRGSGIVQKSSAPVHEMSSAHSHWPPILMDLETRVSVQAGVDEGDKESESRYPNPAALSCPSISSGEWEILGQ